MKTIHNTSGGHRDRLTPIHVHVYAASRSVYDHVVLLSTVLAALVGMCSLARDVAGLQITHEPRTEPPAKSQPAPPSL